MLVLSGTQIVDLLPSRRYKRPAPPLVCQAPYSIIVAVVLDSRAPLSA